MGYIVYDGEVLEFKVDDRLLSHLQIVIVNMFRENRSFLFSWHEPVETGDGRASVWLSPNIALRFKFAGSRTPEINPTWLAALYEAATSGRGLHELPEPVRDAGTRLPHGSGDPVDWTVDPSEDAPPKRRRAARPPGS